VVSPGWNKAGHPLSCGRSSATFLTCAFSSQHFSSYPASSRSDVPSLCPASITSRYDVWSMPGPRARASSSRRQSDTHITFAGTASNRRSLSAGVHQRPCKTGVRCHLVSHSGWRRSREARAAPVSNLSASSAAARRLCHMNVLFIASVAVVAADPPQTGAGLRPSWRRFSRRSTNASSMVPSRGGLGEAARMEA
jgi:hypothetical protein